MALLRRWHQRLAAVVALPALTVVMAGAATGARAAPGTTTPITHLIVIIGENHTFDNVFGTYRPDGGQSVQNLLSEGIVAASGLPGAHVDQARQRMASDTVRYMVDPVDTGAYSTLPQPNTTYVPPACSGQSENVPDNRFPADLGNAPYQITRYVPYFDSHGEYSQFGRCEFNGAFVGDPGHRFYQMYQEISDGSHDLWTWVHETTGASNGARPPMPFTEQSTDQGALDMGFYNMATGDVPTLQFLARRYAMSDNYHQSMMGGTGTNHLMLGTGDAAFHQSRRGRPTAPPPGEIDNPDPQSGTNNFYTQDGFGLSGTTDGGSYSDCSDRTAPGVMGVFNYLDALPYQTFRGGDCAPRHYYMVNNYRPGYRVNGSRRRRGFTVPPQRSLTTIGDALSARGISWSYFGEGYDNGHPGPNYCQICDPMQYATSVMTDPAKRVNIQHGVEDFDADVSAGNLPAVSFLKTADDDGHPGYSTLAAFEAFVSHAVDEVQNNAALWNSTAVLVTFDEGGGYYDSGYVQPTSFFGDGPRVPMIVISPYAKPGFISHTYTDHVSVLKFIERNWQLPFLSRRSLDRLPNPTTRPTNPYLPTNRPAIGDLFDEFDFHRSPAAALLPPYIPARTSTELVPRGEVGR